MLEEICACIHNWFTGRVFSGTFTITGGALEIDLEEGQFFRVIGSKFNDGIHPYPAPRLRDETFTGVIWEMNPPRDFLRLANEISEWQKTYGGAANSPYTSESFGGYSYSKNTATTTGGASMATWQGVFGDRLKQYRKIG